MNTRTAPTVAAVVVTVGRPELRRAVESIVDQTHPVDEIVIVADTELDLDLPDDDRIRVLRIGPRAGAGVGRQHGIENATSDIVALLDDDDSWMARKVEEVLRIAAGHDGDWVAATRVEAHGLDGGPMIWPERTIGQDEPLLEYLFLKRKVRGGTGFVQSSCMAFTRSLALEVPFDPTLRFHQDIGWLVDVAHARPDAPLLQSSAALSVYNVAPGAGSVSQGIRAHESVDWAVARLGGDGPRILGDFILTQSLVLAQRSGSLRVVRDVLLAARKHGRPGWQAWLYAAVATLRTVRTKAL